MKGMSFFRASLIQQITGMACALLILQPASYAQNKARRIAPDFQVKLFDDKVVRAADIQRRITVIDFWATWCKPCLAEIADYNAFYREYKDRGVVLLALALDSGNEDKVKAAAKRLNIEYPAAAPSGKEMKAIGKIRAFPTTWVVGPDGEILREFVGVVAGKTEAIREIVDRLIAEKITEGR